MALKLTLSRVIDFLNSIAILMVLSFASQAQTFQQINKLIGSGNSNPAAQGRASSISADGKTIVSGGFLDNSEIGAIWVYTFDGSGFVQFGNKLVGSGNSDKTRQGWSLSVSADGKTIIVGGYLDNVNIGAAWIYTFNGLGYIQLGNKLVGNDHTGESWQGYSVSISADGKTAIVGGPGDNAYTGAMWVYTFNGTEFVQAGNKLVGSGYIGEPYQGIAVSISADGKTFIEGAKSDNSNNGSAWIFTFNGTNFVQAGNKLIGTGNAGLSQQGSAVDISSDGKVAIVGGFADNNFNGALWVYTFNGTNYIQLGGKLGGYSGAEQGISISITPDGKTIVSAVPKLKEVWLYEFNGANFVQLGAKPSEVPNLGPTAQEVNSADISSDGKIIVFGVPEDGLRNGATLVFNQNNFICIAPTITGISADIHTCAGTSLSLFAKTNGSGLMAYNWYKDQSFLTTEYSGNYNFSSLKASDEGTYFCIVSNNCGSATSAGINLKVNSIDLKGSIPEEICMGDSVKITASGAPILTITGGVPLNENFIPSISDSYTLTGTDLLGCSQSLILNTTLKSVPVIKVFGNKIVCAGAPITLRAIGGTNYRLNNETVTSTFTIRPISSMIYTVTGLYKNQCFNNAFVLVTVNSLPEVSLDLSSINYTCDSIAYIPLSGGMPLKGTYFYAGAPITKFNISKAGNYTIVYRYRDSNSCTNEAVDTLISRHCTVPGLCERPNPPCDCPGQVCFKIYSGFTPNNDGINENWIIDTLPSDNLVLVFDKWGTEVFRAQPYHNDWDGTQKGHKLPEGVYYYFVQTGPDRKKFSGTVSIIR